jgi:hypothetical protein
MTRSRVVALRLVPAARLLVALLLGISVSTLLGRASQSQPEVADAQIEGADRIVVATVRNAQPEWRENEFGDRLIVSRYELDVSETLKGDGAPTVWMEMEGGTLDGLTLRVSSLPALEAGERAVFFLQPAQRGAFGPYMRGHGIMPLDEQDAVRGTSRQLNDLRIRARRLAQ